MTTDTHKDCPKCNQRKEHSEFGKGKNKFNLRPYCKECEYNAMKDRRSRNKDKYNEYMRKLHRKQCIKKWNKAI